MIAILNYGSGNIGSIKNMLNRLGASSYIANSANDLSKATKLILPGVGSFDSAMSSINSMNNLRNTLDLLVHNKKIPVLGLCLGMQILTNSSEEVKLPGLGWIDGVTLKFPSGLDCKIPHMGWSGINKQGHSPLTSSLKGDEKFYFVHSYYVKALKHDNVMLTSKHGIQFDSGISRQNIYGVQFHPEKSHKNGFKIFQDFINIRS